MAKINKPNKKDPIFTHEGARAVHISSEQELRRSVMAYLLWENTFYEDGKSIADRISDLCAKVAPEKIAQIAIEARHDQHLRHVPLLLLRNLVKHGKGSIVADTIAKVISRADELSEFVVIYWEDKKNKKMIPNQMKKGLAKAFTKFNEYSLAKYNRDVAVKLRDVLFLCHAKPKDEEQALLWKKLVDGDLPVPDTWEVQLSGGVDKKETFERLIREGKLGYLALLRNLRNMEQAGCDVALVKAAIEARQNGADKVLPFRFIAAARNAVRYEPSLDKALLATVENLPQLKGTTAVLVDVSGSMHAKLSGKSDLTRQDAAAALASIINAEDLRVFSFADKIIEIPPRRGMAGIEAIVKSQSGGTRLYDAVARVNDLVNYDRIIVITDEQTLGPNKQSFGYFIRGDLNSLPDPKPGTKGYMINVANYQNGVGYGVWTHIDGFSENIIRWIVQNEITDL